MPDLPPGKVPARYIGAIPFELPVWGGPYLNVDGSRRKKLTLYQGDELLWEAHNVLGQTHLRQKATGKRYFLGYGRKVLPEHATLSDEELAVLGYEFDEGRPDFEPITPDTTPAQMPNAPVNEALPPELAAAVDAAKREAEAEAEQRREQQAAQTAGQASLLPPTPVEAGGEPEDAPAPAEPPAPPVESAPAVPEMLAPEETGVPAEPLAESSPIEPPASTEA